MKGQNIVEVGLWTLNLEITYHSKMQQLLSTEFQNFTSKIKDMPVDVVQPLRDYINKVIFSQGTRCYSFISTPSLKLSGYGCSALHLFFFGLGLFPLSTMQF